MLFAISWDSSSVVSPSQNPFSGWPLTSGHNLFHSFEQVSVQVRLTIWCLLWLENARSKVTKLNTGHRCDDRTGQGCWSPVPTDQSVLVLVIKITDPQQSMHLSEDFLTERCINIYVNVQLRNLIRLRFRCLCGCLGYGVNKWKPLCRTGFILFSSIVSGTIPLFTFLFALKSVLHVHICYACCRKPAVP